LTAQAILRVCVVLRPETESSATSPSRSFVRGCAAATALAGCSAINAEPISLRVEAPSTLADGLVGYWKLDESTPTERVLDSSGQGTEGTPANGPLPSPLVAPAKIRNSASRVFNGVDQYIDLGNPATLNFEGPITLAAWVSAASMPEGCRVVLGHGFRHDPKAEISLRSGHGVCDREGKPPSWQVGVFDGVDFFADAPIDAEDIGTWIHLTGTFDGKTWRLYRNATEVDELETAKGPFSFEASWSIGGRAYPTPPEPRVFDGSIDDVRLYNRALTPAEVTDLYNL
jgi:hypothetical protein